jgi:murein DD-endopeptidase MepM/ murein hydrolase activator NlpD
MNPTSARAQAARYRQLAQHLVTPTYRRILGTAFATESNQVNGSTVRADSRQVMLLGRVVMATLALTALNASATYAASISGHIRDTAGTPISGIVVQLSPYTSASSASAPSDTNGFYQIANVPAGRAHVRVKIDDRSLNVVFIPVEDPCPYNPPTSIARCAGADYTAVLVSEIAVSTTDVTEVDFVRHSVPEARSGFQRPICLYSYGWTFAQSEEITGGGVFHPGQDISCSPSNTRNTIPVLAAADGLIVDIRPPSAPGSGSTESKDWGGIVVKHWYRGSAYYTQYGHISIDLDRDPLNGVQSLSLGGTVRKGSVLGYEDNIGAPLGQHLHFEVRTSVHPKPCARNYFASSADTIAKWYEHPEAFIDSSPDEGDPRTIVVDERERVVAGEALPPTKWFTVSGETLFTHVQPDGLAGGLSGYGGHMQYVRTTTGEETASGVWTFRVESDGLYDVQAYIPIAHKTSQAAVYRLDGVDLPAVNQAAISDNWVPLASGHQFTAALHELRLANNTGEIGKEVAFDAVRVLFRGNSSTLLPNPVVSESLIVSPGPAYVAGQTVTATFAITNRGFAPVTFTRLLVGGRLNGDSSCSGGCPDFTDRPSQTLSPGQTYFYSGTQTLYRPGDYSFFVAYVPVGGNWVSHVPTDPGVNNTAAIHVDGGTVPFISGISPTLASATTFDLTINGDNFGTAGVERIYWKNTGALVGNGTIQARTSSTQIVVREYMTGATPGTYQVRVKTADGLLSAPTDFELTAPVTVGPPTVASINPPSPPAVNLDQDVGVVGTNFQANLTVDVFNRSGTRIGTLSGAQIRAVTPTSFTMAIKLGATPDIFGIEVVNPDTKRSIRFTFSSVGNPDFSVTASPVARAITRGMVTTFALSMQSVNGFNSPVSLSWLNLPAGYVASGTGWSPATVTPPAGGSATATLTVATGPNTGTGTFTITLRGTSGAIVRDRNVTLTVNAATAVMVSPVPGSTLSATSATFSWTSVVGADLYDLNVGTSPGARDLFDMLDGVNTSTTVSLLLPSDGSTLHVTLWTRVASVWQYSMYTYTATSISGKASMLRPAPGSVLSSSAVLFEWVPASGGTWYDLYVGSARGMNDVYGGGQTTGTSTWVTSLPADGRKLFVRLWSWLGGVWIYNDYVYVASSVPTANVIGWEFNAAANWEGWTVYNAYSEVTGGALNMDPGSGDFYISGPTLAVSAAAYGSLSLRMGSNAADANGAIYFRTQAENFFSEDKRIAFQVSTCTLCGTAPYYTYTVTMAGHPKWAGTITGIRLDPAQNGTAGTNTDAVGIDYIRLIP